MITGVVLARNEECNIVPCLEHFQHFVDDLILIDMASEDQTVELARPLVSTVLHHPLISNFDSARNIAIPAAKHDWLWFCDADERPSQRAADTVRQVIQEHGNDFEAISIPFKSYFAGKWIQHSGWWPGYTMPRVLKRGHFFFREQIHGGVQVDGREIRINPDPEAAIEHFSYSSIEHYLTKFNRYTSTEAKQLAEAGHRWDWRLATTEMARDLWTYYEANQGNLDEQHGWILAWLSGLYRWVSRAKLIDLSETIEESYPASIDEFTDVFVDAINSLRHGSCGPLGIHWHSPIDDGSGYADEGRCFVKATSSGKRDVSLRKLQWGDVKIDLPIVDQALFQSLQRQSPRGQYVAITNSLPTIARPDPNATWNVLRTTFETDRIPDFWLPFLNSFDEVWVISKHNFDAFVRGGFAPERLRIVPTCLDTDLYTPEGDARPLQRICEENFVFLSVFDWQYRKGWDVLLRAYANEFAASEGAQLLIKYSHSHGQTNEDIQRAVDETLRAINSSLDQRPDIVLWEETLSARQMAALYRGADAFVLPSRGEGWGRPYMEAMACGLPTIGTTGSGNVDFMNHENSFLVDTKNDVVSDIASTEVPVFADQNWNEPDEQELRKQMRLVFGNPSERHQRAERAIDDIRRRFDLSNGRRIVEQEICRLEDLANNYRTQHIGSGTVVNLEGEFLSNHSFSNINEAITNAWNKNERTSTPLRIVPRNDLAPKQESKHRVYELLNHCHNQTALPEVTIRHAYPPDWTPVTSGKWVHIQPWEFGHLPKDWIHPLKNMVDEIWVPSNYVRDVFVASGISESKIQVIPWGIDPSVFCNSGVKRYLHDPASFNFLFVGGTIERKGFDRALNAYLQEFSSDEDVGLVVKDAGHDTFYRGANYWEQTRAAALDQDLPKITGIDDELTPGQLAALYRTCDCYLAPYRGEGFGLPILEAMACGLPPIVPTGGPTDDFVNEETGYVISSNLVETSHPDELCGVPLEFSIDIDVLRKAMREAFENSDATRRMGASAATFVNASMTWDHTVQLMQHRIQKLTADQTHSNGYFEKLPIEVVVNSDESSNLQDCLSRITPFAELVVVVTKSTGQAEIAQQYGCVVRSPSADLDEIDRQSSICTLMIPSRARLQDADWRRLGESVLSTELTKQELVFVDGNKGTFLPPSLASA